MIGLSRFAHLLVVAAALIACASVPTPSQTPSVSPSAPPPPSASPSPSIAATVADTAGGFSFQRPSGWTRWQPNEHNPINDGPLIYLSTDPLLPACAVVPEASPNPPNGQGRACDRPLTTLAPNGVLVTWLTTRILVPLPSAGERIEMNGDEARIKIERPGGCASIGGDESIYVLVPIGQPTPLSNLAVSACLRGPDLATAEVQVRVMLVSATIGQ